MKSEKPNIFANYNKFFSVHLATLHKVNYENNCLDGKKKINNSSVSKCFVYLLCRSFFNQTLSNIRNLFNKFCIAWIRSELTQNFIRRFNKLFSARNIISIKLKQFLACCLNICHRRR